MIIQKILNRLKKKNQPTYTHLEPIPWSAVVSECYNQGLNFTLPVIEVIYTDDKSERAVILQKSERLYSLVYEKLCPYHEDELKYISEGLHGFWSSCAHGNTSLFETRESAVKAVYSDAPFKYNKSVIWADAPFRIDADRLYWIKDDGLDDPDDLCLHGRVLVKIGKEIFDYDATVNAAGLYLLRTLTDNHIIHEKQFMLPCCGNMMIASDDFSSVDILGCNNGLDWSVLHENGGVRLVTQAGKEAFIDIDDYRNEVYAFADKVEEYYQNCLSKNVPVGEEFEWDGYTAFWNEWHRRRG
ncbi:MAG: hypothetical protein FWG87_05110 [Defluviitaleaceae bacterium]|nr:hypothetical protein [Defluviitaleaceae bacterium]